ncbi:hypothetical protein MDA_GLEAN10012282 [Myotis davidii]|uniref:Uncharacterized protein n=1 Tax=Myotis davidii TaxID=225400 RepID=L5LG19_MYODS|nr:hypothetical protein MDA_GLEAN10012282 [Myotis davidii]
MGPASRHSHPLTDVSGSSGTSSRCEWGRHRQQMRVLDGTMAQQEQRIFSNHQRLTLMTATDTPPWSGTPPLACSIIPLRPMPTMFNALLLNDRHFPHVPPGGQHTS